MVPTATKGLGGDVVEASSRSRLEAATATLRAAAREASETLRLRALWRVVLFSVAVFGVAKQWSEGEQLMPAFLERRFGEGVPIYTIHSINLWGCLLLPPLVAARTSDLEPFRVIVPGLWIMALSPRDLGARLVKGPCEGE